MVVDGGGAKLAGPCEWLGGSVAHALADVYRSASTAAKRAAEPPHQLPARRAISVQYYCSNSTCDAADGPAATVAAKRRWLPMHAALKREKSSSVSHHGCRPVRHPCKHWIGYTCCAAFAVIAMARQIHKWHCSSQSSCL